jgi:hypothetical protein
MIKNSQFKITYQITFYKKIPPDNDDDQTYFLQKIFCSPRDEFSSLLDSQRNHGSTC